MYGKYTRSNTLRKLDGFNIMSVMRNKIILLCIVFVVFAFIIAGRFLFLSVQAQDGRLKVITSPKSVLYLNNMQVGKTPFDQKIKQGEYILKLQAENDSSQSAVFEEKIKINRNTLTYVNEDLGASDLTTSGVVFTIEKMTSSPEKANTGEIEVQSEPSGATVYLDSEEHGNTALILSSIDKGQHEVTVSSPGFFPRNEKIEVKTGYRVIARFKLPIDPSHKKIDESIDSKLASDSAKSNITPTLTPSTKTTITISDTGTGFLRVRAEPNLSSSESARVIPGNTFAVLEEQTGWFKIEYEKGKTGWVSSRYSTIETQ